MNDGSKFTIVKSEKTYSSIVPNAIFKNKDISLKAKGLYALIFTLPEDQWDFSVKGLISIVSEGSRAVYSALKELEEYGYITRKQSRASRGFGSMEYVIYDAPCDSVHVQNVNAQNVDAQNATQYNNINNIIFNEDTSTSIARTREGWDSLELTDIWQENIRVCIFQMFRLEMPQEAIQAHLDAFKAYQKAVGTPYNESDARRHFVAFVVKRIEKDTKKNNVYGTNRNDSTPESRQQEASAIIARLIAEDESAAL